MTIIIKLRGMVLVENHKNIMKGREEQAAEDRCKRF
jgi:hypothetical protein